MGLYRGRRAAERIQGRVRPGHREVPGDRRADRQAHDRQHHPRQLPDARRVLFRSQGVSRVRRVPEGRQCRAGRCLRPVDLQGRRRQMSADGSVRPAPRGAGIPGLPAWLVVLVVPVATLALWELAGRAGMLPTGLIPTPSMTVNAWYVWTFGPDTGGFNAYSGPWGGVVLNSGQRVVQGYILAVLIAVPVGILIGWSSVVARLIDPTIQSLRPIPITAWLPFSIAMFGIKDYGAIFLICLGAFYPILISTTHGEIGRAHV